MKSARRIAVYRILSAVCAAVLLVSLLSVDALASGGRFQLHRYHLQPGVGIGIHAQPRRGDHQNDHKNGYIFHRFHSIEDRMLFMR